MKKHFSRKDFLKVSTAAATAATGFGPLVRRVARQPFSRPPEEDLPGEAIWYASTCNQCPAGCGIVVRVIDGQVKKIEGNPHHPLNKGKLCARGQAGLQQLYDPDRLQGPVIQEGGRGSRKFTPLYWGEAMDLLVDKFQTLSQPQRAALWGGSIPDHLNRMMTIFMQKMDGEPPYLYDLHTALEGRVLNQQVSTDFFGASTLPVYDIAHSDVIFSFGANILETWMSPVSQGRAYGQFSGRGHLVHFEPRMSTTAACADEWIPLSPGAAGYAALAIGRIIIEERLGLVWRYQPYTELYRGVNIQEMAELSELPLQKLRELARIFAEADRPLAIPGGGLSGQTNGVESSYSVQALNVLMSQLGRPGGVYQSHPGPTDDFQEKTALSTFERIESLVDKMKGGEIDLLLIHSGNPAFGLPSSLGFEDALANVPYVVSFSPTVDETAVHADLILPDHTYLESWGYRVPDPGMNRPLVSNFQPVVHPVYDTRSTADVLLRLAQRLGGEMASALPWEDEVDYLESTILELYGSSISIYDPPSSSGFWEKWRQLGGWWSEKEIRIEPTLTSNLTQPLEIHPPRFAGEPEEFPFIFYPYPSITLSDGRGANSPWLQETPDPMTTARWRSWVEINPATASTLGIGDNDVVRVSSPHGTLESPVVVYPGIRPDVIAMPVGQGHTDYGRFARNRGENPMDIIAPLIGEGGASLAWGATRVKIEPVHAHFELARLESLDGKGRETLE